VLKIDVSTMLDRSEDEFVNSLAKSVGRPHDPSATPIPYPLYHSINYDAD